MILLLDEAVASRAVIVIVSGLDERAESLLGTTVRDMPYMSMGSHGWAIPIVLPNPPNPGVKKSP